MRRISLALALIGAVAVTGCSGGANPSSDDGKGTAGVNFTVRVNNQGPGTVVSSPAGINCAPDTECAATFASGTTVTLTATPNGSNYFNGWYGACGGTEPCVLSGDADKYVVAYFSAQAESHPNWANGHPALSTLRMDCARCHGAQGQGIGLAPACTTCHKAGGPAPESFALNQQGETCAACHPTDGAYHQSIYNKYVDTPSLVATIDEVTSSLNTDGVTYTSTLKFTLSDNGVPFTALDTLGQKRFTATKYDTVTKRFDYDTAITYGTTMTATGVAGQYTVKAAAAKFAPELSDAFAYLYVAGPKPTIIPPKGHYQLYDNVASAAKSYGTLDYVSTANVSACENCHGKPYMKHGYRAGVVAGVPDMVACKACHTDNRPGTDWVWQLLVNDPVAASKLTVDDEGETVYSPEQQAMYAYTATIMNDTHMSHAMEFAYPQSMGNCVTCHEGKLDKILTDANFTGATCKSCHPWAETTGQQAKRAPKLEIGYHTIDWEKGVLVHDEGGTSVERPCNFCHADAASYVDGVWSDTGGAIDNAGPSAYGQPVPLLKDIHNGYDHRVYAAEGKRLTEIFTTALGTVAFDTATKKLTVPFTVTKTDPGSLTTLTVSDVTPLLVISLYGYDTKDFIVGGHGNAADGKRNLEAAVGSTHPRISFTGSAGSWTATVDLTLWADRIGADKAIRRAEIGVLPKLLSNPAETTSPALAISGISKTFSLVTNAFVDDAYGRNIVDTAKCNKCHEALAIEFHNASYGSAGVVGCRLCHIVGSGGSHLEMQSRSIDSYVHSLHSMQKMDIGDVNFADPVAAMFYDHHVESTYPNFTTLNCESCHNPGTYNVPSNALSLPGILSASETITGGTREIGGVPSVVTGPGSRACGGCHRAQMINEDDAAQLGWFDEHTGSWGYREVPVAPATTATLLDEIIEQVLGAAPAEP